MQVCETMLPSFIVDSDLVSPRNSLDDCTAVGVRAADFSGVGEWEG